MPSAISACSWPGRPAGVPGEDPQVPVRPGDDLDRRVQVQQARRCRTAAASPAAPRPAAATLARQIAPFGETGPPWNSSCGLDTVLTQSGSTASSGVWEISFKITPSAPSSSQSRTSTTVWLKTPSASSTLATSTSPGVGSRSAIGRAAVRRGHARRPTARDDQASSQQAADDDARSSRPARRAGRRTGRGRTRAGSSSLTTAWARRSSHATSTRTRGRRPRPGGAARTASSDQDHRQRRSPPRASTLSAPGNQAASGGAVGR